ncbi:hypothetical protein [Blastopirellula marina]|uniref:hypothetical protein n=1 Tax=Blastopirellula marina TaxID=124 RepID=UPI0012B57255|nr:hypothetical protein [Blastopirellula marina]
MKHYRINVEIDITATDAQQAERRSFLLFSDLEQRRWVKEILPNGILERRPITPGKGA